MLGVVYNDELGDRDLLYKPRKPTNWVDGPLTILYAYLGACIYRGSLPVDQVAPVLDRYM